MPFKLNCYRCGQEKVEIIVILSEDENAETT